MNTAIDILAEGQQSAKRALVVGLGLTGHSVVRYLRAEGMAVAAVDSRELPPGLEMVRREHPEVTVRCGEFDADLVAAYDFIVTSPGVPLREPLLQAAAARGAEIVGDIELFARAVEAPVVAITGSNGKSTVTTLVGEMLKAAGKRVAVGGNIGRPALELLPPAGSDESLPDFYVLELSSFQLETTENLRPASAALLNISPDHMDRYPDLGAYSAAKARLLRHASTAVLNRQDPTVMAFAGAVGDTVTFGLDTPPTERDFGLREMDGERWLCHGSLPLCGLHQLTIVGDQNVANVLAAMALLSQSGVALSPAAIAAACGFRGLRHRCETVVERRGVRWINDSKGTNVGATCAAIAGFDRPLVLIAGGQGKGADFGALREAVVNRARVVLVLGEDAKLIAAALRGVVETRRMESLAAAVTVAAKLAQPGDAVLFSPACASFDMFDSYVQRGDAFRQLVEGLDQ